MRQHDRVERIVTRWTRQVTPSLRPAADSGRAPPQSEIGMRRDLFCLGQKFSANKLKAAAVYVSVTCP